MVETDKKLLQQVAEKEAMDFLAGLPVDNYTSIKNMGELQYESGLSVEL